MPTSHLRVGLMLVGETIRTKITDSLKLGINLIVQMNKKYLMQQKTYPPLEKGWKGWVVFNHTILPKRQSGECAELKGFKLWRPIHITFQLIHDNIIALIELKINYVQCRMSEPVCASVLKFVNWCVLIMAAIQRTWF